MGVHVSGVTYEMQHILKQVGGGHMEKSTFLSPSSTFEQLHGVATLESDEPKDSITRFDCKPQVQNRARPSCIEQVIHRVANLSTYLHADLLAQIILAAGEGRPSNSEHLHEGLRRRVLLLVPRKAEPILLLQLAASPLGCLAFRALRTQTFFVYVRAREQASERGSMKRANGDRDANRNIMTL